MHRPPLAHSVARVLGILLLVGLGCSADHPEATARRGPPNLLVILADDLSVNEVGLYAGGPPNLNRGPKIWTRRIEQTTHEPSRLASYRLPVKSAPRTASRGRRQKGPTAPR